MKKITSALLLALVCFGAVAQAGEFEDRQNLALKKAMEGPLRQCYARNYQSNAKSINEVRGFLAQHPAASDAKCSAYKIGCQCVGTFCQPYAVDGSDGEIKIALSKVKSNSEISINSCDVSLKDGNFCRINLSRYGEKDPLAVCYDSHGNRQDY